MAQAIISPENLAQAVLELKEYIDGLRTSISFKDVPIKVEDSPYIWYQEDGGINYIHMGLSGNVFEANTIQWNGNTYDINHQFYYPDFNDNGNFDITFSFSVDSGYCSVGYLIKNTQITIWEDELNSYNISLEEIMSGFPSFDDEEKTITVTLSSEIINNTVTGNKVEYLLFSDIYSDFYTNSLLTNKLFARYSFVTDSNLYVCDSSRIINSENKSMYYLYIERWDSRNHKWSIFMDPESIHPICLAELETEDDYYYKVPWTAIEIISKMKLLKTCPNMLIRIGFGIGFTHDGIQDNSYNNAKFIYKYNPTFVKIRSMRFKNVLLKNENTDQEYGECNTLLFHFSTITKCETL